jgi:hypothetical protein
MLGAYCQKTHWAFKQVFFFFYTCGLFILSNKYQLLHRHHAFANNDYNNLSSPIGSFKPPQSLIKKWLLVSLPLHMDGPICHIPSTNSKTSESLKTLGSVK